MAKKKSKVTDDSVEQVDEQSKHVLKKDWTDGEGQTHPAGDTVAVPDSVLEYLKETGTV